MFRFPNLVSKNLSIKGISFSSVCKCPLGLHLEEISSSEPSILSTARAHWRFLVTFLKFNKLRKSWKTKRKMCASVSPLRESVSCSSSFLNNYKIHRKKIVLFKSLAVIVSVPQIAHRVLLNSKWLIKIFIGKLFWNFLKVLHVSLGLTTYRISLLEVASMFSSSVKRIEKWSSSIFPDLFHGDL